MSKVSPIEALLQARGFTHYGFAPLERPLSFDIYRAWLERGDHGEMDYLVRHAALKEDPRRFAPRAKSAIVIGQPYLPHPYSSGAPKTALKTALYAKGRDYHFSFHRELEELASALSQTYVGQEFLCYADSAPILERDLAYRAGLGWVGKNTCLIHPRRGSLFWLGQILTTLDLGAKAQPTADMCGTCDRCVRACPTGALEEPRRLNANKCIAHWTIEARTAAPAHLRDAFGDWFFGCDVCQIVCPWNEKHHGRDLLKSLSETSAPRAELVRDIGWILSVSHREILRTFRNTALSRARPLTLKRSALIVVANRGLGELRPEVERACASPDLKEVAEWTLERLT